MYYGVQYYPEHWPPNALAGRRRHDAARGREHACAWASSPGAPSSRKRASSTSAGWTAPSTCWPSTASRSSCAPARARRRRGCSALSRRRQHHRRRQLNNAGFRYPVGLAHPEFIELAERIDRAVVEHFAGHPAIAGWQVDNEVGGQRLLLRALPGAISRVSPGEVRHGRAAQRGLGHALLVLHLFRRFDEVPLPAPTGCSTPPAARARIPALPVEAERRLHPLARRADPPARPGQVGDDQLPVLPGAAHRLLSDGGGHRPQRHEPLPGALAGVHPRLLPGRTREGVVLEQCTRLGPVDIGEGWMRLWAWIAIGHGACGINFFRWRSAAGARSSTPTASCRMAGRRTAATASWRAWARRSRPSAT